MACRGACHKYKAKWASSQFRMPQARKDAMCVNSVNWDDKNCPCCGMRLRTRPRISKYRQKFNGYVLDQL